MTPQQLDSFIRRHEPGSQIGPDRVARLTRSVMGRVAQEPRAVPWARLLAFDLAALAPRMAASVAVGLVLGVMAGMAGSAPDLGTPLLGTAELVMAATPLSPLGL